MQYDPERAYPFPVLRPGNNDYIDGEYQATVEYDVGEPNAPVTSTVVCSLSVPELNALIEKGLAQYVAVFSCRSTFLRHVESSSNRAFQVEFSPGSLRGRVDFFPFIVATTEISEYRSSLINEEWGVGPYAFPIGSILATDEPSSVYIDRDVFRPISSIFVLVKSDEIGPNEWRVDLEEEKVRIVVSATTKEVLDVARNSVSNRAVLINSLYLSAVTHCVRALRDVGDYVDRRWAQVLSQQAEVLGIDLSSEEEYIVAQRLLQGPFGLLKKYTFAEVG